MASCLFSSANSFVVGGIAYTPISDSEVAVTQIDGFSYYGKIVIPETVKHNDVQYTVIKVGDSAFYECYCLTDITLPKTIVEIGNFAFCSCPNLKAIVLPESLQTLGTKAFWECVKINKLIIPSKVETIPDFCFEGCSSLVSLTFGKSVKTICKNAFSNCVGLTTIKIPASATSIQSGAFKDCKKLATVTFENQQNVKVDTRNAFANSPYGNANSQNAIKNDSRFKVKNSVTY